MAELTQVPLYEGVHVRTVWTPHCCVLWRNGRYNALYICGEVSGPRRETSAGHSNWNRTLSTGSCIFTCIYFHWVSGGNYRTRFWTNEARGLPLRWSSPGASSYRLIVSCVYKTLPHSKIRVLVDNPLTLDRPICFYFISSLTYPRIILYAVSD